MLPAMQAEEELCEGTIVAHLWDVPRRRGWFHGNMHATIEEGD